MYDSLYWLCLPCSPYCSCPRSMAKWRKEWNAKQGEEWWSPDYCCIVIGNKQTSCQVCNKKWFTTFWEGWEQLLSLHIVMTFNMWDFGIEVIMAKQHSSKWFCSAIQWCSTLSSSCKMQAKNISLYVWRTCNPQLMCVQWTPARQESRTNDTYESN